MKRLTLALGAFVLALTAVPRLPPRLYRPEWVVVQWVNGDCKIWHNDINAPLGGGWRAVAFSRNPTRSRGASFAGSSRKRKCNL